MARFAASWAQPKMAVAWCRRPPRPYFRLWAVRLQKSRGRRLPGHPAQLAPGPRTRDRPDRGDCPRLRLQPLRQHASRFLRHRQRDSPRKQGSGHSPDAARAGLERGRIQHLLLCHRRGYFCAAAGRCACPWAIRSTKRPACCVPRCCPGCSPCWPTTSTATSTMSSSSRWAPFSAADPERVDERPALALGASGVCLERAGAACSRHRLL